MIPPARHDQDGGRLHDPRAGLEPLWHLVFGDGTAAEADGAGIRPLDGPGNMAVDQALLDAVKAGGAPVLRLYRWDPATLSFGRTQPARGLYDAEAARARAIAFVRRPTGGQAVLHDDELTYAVVAPVPAVGRPREAYRRINAALVEGLRRPDGALTIHKGTSGEDGYSAFSMRDPVTGVETSTPLPDALAERGVTSVVVVGVALDVCVRATAEDAMRLGYDVTLVADATAAVDLEAGDGYRAVAALVGQGVAVV